MINNRSLTCPRGWDWAGWMMLVGLAVKGWPETYRSLPAKAMPDIS